MPKLKANQVPSYRLHKQSGQAIVTLNGRGILLGRHGSAASKSEYRRVTAEWLATKGLPTHVAGDLTVSGPRERCIALPLSWLMREIA